MRPLRHSYTNTVRSDDSLVVESYEGPDRSIRRQRELVALTRLQGYPPSQRCTQARLTALSDWGSLREYTARI